MATFSKYILSAVSAILVGTSTNAQARDNLCIPRSAQMEVDAIKTNYTTAPLRYVGHAHVPLPSTILYDHLTDSKLITAWMSGIKSATYDHSKSENPGQLGIGSTRVLIAGRRPDFEIIEVAERGSMFAYRITEGPPVSKHIAIMRIEETETGSLFSWYQYFDGTEKMNADRMAKRVKRFVRKSQKKLVLSLGGEIVETCESD